MLFFDEIFKSIIGSHFNHGIEADNMQKLKQK